MKKRKMAGKDINVYRKKKRKLNVMEDNKFSVNMEHSVKESATYKPKRIGPTNLGANERVTKETADNDFSACMEHSAKASATYKPKRSIEPAKRRLKQPIMNKLKKLDQQNQQKKTEVKFVIHISLPKFARTK